ncbi:hypothetical protein NP882_004770 [Escherichia coli]|uniref:acyltransferase n=1 Tax=Enterobacteriaceae TaxID=543 RepID=UPI000DFE0ACC|nr:MULTISPECIES: acyltransferase [Enterobacteriaceae]EFL5751350.1 acyltransferase [Escherichia coli P12b]EFH4339344.1 acyltransferase [Escherichia coli]EFO0471430.1 acyltransferase [Escherichia coli]EJN3600291.1 hypothetical protein [Escherichia coli]EJN4389391.1 hypothetical protein [Escherichia coli]
MTIFDNYKHENNIKIHPSSKISPDVTVSITGSGHTIEIGENTVLRNLKINISGKNNFLVIKDNCSIRGTLHLRQTGSKITINSFTTTVSSHIFSMEGSDISIGTNCMLSSGVFIRNSDEHPIYDIETNERMNNAQAVIVGNNVWIGEGATVNKGSAIPDGCIIGAKSFVSKKLKRKNAVYVGVPVQLIRESVKWERTFR